MTSKARWKTLNSRFPLEPIIPVFVCHPKIVGRCSGNPGAIGDLEEQLADNGRLNVQVGIGEWIGVERDVRQ